MKIKKILKILICSNTTLCICLPIASCSNNWMDLNYTPSIKEHEKAEMDSTEAVLDEYYQKCLNNTEIINQDYIWTIAQVQNNFLKIESETVKNKRASYIANASNLKIAKKSLQSKDYYVISGQFYSNTIRQYTLTQTVEGQDTLYKMYESINYTCILKDVCISLSYSSDLNKWSVYANANNSFDWEIHTIYNQETKYEIESNGDAKKFTNIRNEDSISNKYHSEKTTFSYDSYYLKNISIKR